MRQSAHDVKHTMSKSVTQFTVLHIRLLQQRANWRTVCAPAHLAINMKKSTRKQITRDPVLAAIDALVLRYGCRFRASRALGTHPSMLPRWQSGERYPSGRMVVRIQELIAFDFVADARVKLCMLRHYFHAVDEVVDLVCIPGSRIDAIIAGARVKPDEAERVDCALRDMSPSSRARMSAAYRSHYKGDF